MIDIECIADFECANAAFIERRGPAAFSFRTRPDDAVDTDAYAGADYYWAVRLRNPNEEPVVCELVVGESDVPPDGRTVAVRERGPSPSVRDWRPLDRDHVLVDAEANTQTVSTTVPAGGELDAASMYWMSASDILARLMRWKREHPEKMTLLSLGETARGRSLPAVDLSALSPPGAPVALVGATPQCHELGSIAVMDIIEAALAGDLDEVTNRVRLRCLPLPNPDGNALGHCMTNGERRNIIFGFDRAGTDAAAVECELAWRYALESSPAFYLEFHSYPHLNRPSFRPYDFDLAFFPDDASRERGRVFFEAVRSAAPNPPVRVEQGSRMDAQFGSSLPYRLIAEHGVPATLYKLHNRETVADNTAHAREVLARVAAAAG